MGRHEHAGRGHQAAEATTALWWVPSGHRPSTDEAEDRVRHTIAATPAVSMT